MQIRVRAASTVAPEITATVPLVLNPLLPPLSKAGQSAFTRRVLLFEGLDGFGRIQPMLGRVTGTQETGLSALPLMWTDPVTETPKAGTVEIWEIYNTTADAHPIHLHEIVFSVLDRQPISFDKKDTASECGMSVQDFPIRLQAKSRPSEPYERGFKDTVITYPGEVTRIVADFTAASPGRFVWHCHILEHEDHEMMRPYDILAH
jgi:spore coat protein A, manganese oxidase